MIKKILILVIVILIAMQFIRPEKNTNLNQTNINQIPEPVWNDLKVACYDCHSNHTNYPWYSHIQPVAWWLNEHVVDGKRKLNFDNKLSGENLEEIAEVIENNEMPLFSYTLIHRNAKLSDLQKKAILNWTAQHHSQGNSNRVEHHEEESHENESE